MPEAKGTICPKCGALIFMAKSTRGQGVPFDAQKITVYAQDLAGVMQAAGGPGHACHFATCAARKPAPPKEEPTSGST